ncbi:MAG: biotin--[acetyl-CoA-carboxylase] ligase [Desulfosporosinus sp.]|jgi:BirA family biotin operon repressor/biotin-[acetyl-CoA-carboxylase] ligase
MATIKEKVNGEAALPHKRIHFMGKNIYLYREVTSTNSVAQLLARSGASEGTIVLSRSQLSGRGRFSRQWICPPGQGILMSMVLRPEINGKLIPQLTLLCGVVVVESINKTTGCKAGIKWPNDVVMSGKKVCGILAQSIFSKTALEHVIIGVGINVNLDTCQLPSDCRETSTSLRMESGQNISRWQVLKQFISSWDKHYHSFLHGGHSYLRTKWLENNVTLGRDVSINRDKGPVQGKAIDISTKGGLLVRFPDGSIEEFMAEDLSLGRNHYVRDL